MTPAYLDAAAIAAITNEGEAVALLERALENEVDPEQDSPRLFSPAPDGEFLLMPAAGSRYCGVKVATVAPDNPAVGLPKIQGVYVLFDSRTLAPLILLDGAELTLLRTPATTALAVKHILAAEPRGRSEGNGEFPSSQIGTLLVFGTGPQAWRHILAIRAVAPVKQVLIVGRRQTKTDALVRRCIDAGMTARSGTAAEVADADVIVCASSASDVLFDGALVQAHAVVAAVGAHGLGTREIDPALARRADVVVEGRASAMRESGDLIPARSAEEWERETLTNLAELVRGEFTRSPDRPSLYTGVGMSWEDVVIAAGVYEHWLGRPEQP